MLPRLPAHKLLNEPEVAFVQLRPLLALHAFVHLLEDIAEDLVEVRPAQPRCDSGSSRLAHSRAAVVAAVAATTTAVVVAAATMAAVVVAAAMTAVGAAVAVAMLSCYYGDGGEAVGYPKRATHARCPGLETLGARQSSVRIGLGLGSGLGSGLGAAPPRPAPRCPS
eukprot:scaffold81913_cov63-Phaeocystis_antarctica.AAC.2